METNHGNQGTLREHTETVVTCARAVVRLMLVVL